jgi:hypothetical protein
MIVYYVYAAPTQVGAASMIIEINIDENHIIYVPGYTEQPDHLVS